MQERENTFDRNASLKRQRDLDGSQMPPKKFAPSFTSDYLMLPKDKSSEEFHTFLSQSGNVKAFWYFPNIKNLIRSQKEPKFSEWFSTGNGIRWRVLIFFNRNACVSCFVEMDFEPNMWTLTRSAYVWMEAHMSNGIKTEKKVSLNFHKTFTFSKRDWGYDDFIEHDKFMSYLSHPIIFEITVNPVSPHDDSKELTGYVGLINEGTTCYMNSLLQTLFFLSPFRRAVYSMKTGEEDQDQIPLALQQVFYSLQFYSEAASTKDLIASFGWGLDERNTQHDVQEFNCVLSDTLERKMKGTPAEGTYSRLFEGKMINYIACTNVDFKSERIETFTDIQLNVKGCKDIYESFEKYVEIEDLTGDNQYEAENLGKQDARKGVIFDHFPPVLLIQLKRFDYNSFMDNTMKINDRYEFFEEIDLDKYVSLKSRGNNKYRLFSILVHSGNLAAGHYYSYISPKLNQNWYKFNDDSVDFALPTQAIEANFGGEIPTAEVTEKGEIRQLANKNESSAYMLVYINENLKDEVLREVNREDIPEPLHEIIHRKTEAKRLAEEQKKLKNAKFDIFVVTFEMIFGWDKPGISPSSSFLHGETIFATEKSRRYRLSIDKKDNGKALKDFLQKYTEKQIRLWVFAPGYKNWEFKELKPDDIVEKELGSTGEKAIYIQAEDNAPLFVQSEEMDTEDSQVWKFAREIEDTGYQTADSEGTEIMEDTLYVNASNNEKVTVFYKWYSYENGIPTLQLIDCVVLRNSCTLADIRASLYTKIYGSDPEQLKNMYLHQERCKTQEPKNKEFIMAIHSFEPEKNFEIPIGKKASFGVKFVTIDNGDAWIGEMVPNPLPPNYIDAKRFISEMCNEIYVIAKYNDKYEKYGYKSYSRQLMEHIEYSNEFPLKTKFSYFQKDLMQQLADIFRPLEPSITPANIQIYTKKSHMRFPQQLPYPYSEEENPLRFKKSSTNPSLASIIENSNILYFDIMPFPIPQLEHKIIVYCYYLTQNYEMNYEFLRTLPETATVKDFDQEIKNEVMSVMNTDKTIDLGSLEEVKYLLLTHPQKAILQELEYSSNLSVHSKNSNVMICIRAVLNKESELRQNPDYKKINVFTYVKGTEIYCNPLAVYIKKSWTCKEVIHFLLDNREPKSRVMITNYYNYGESHEYKPQRPLEDSEECFCPKYEDKTLAIELPNPEVKKSELRFKTNETLS
ncbi:unnamed protein product [Blepharisma stoltei]|uniref:Ubiquitinyl hydrolase 1 n=1 Tax=Blepharisma stoltei TaxID=1481888 RepID=A0AAU9IIY0_9CILI|nr:unnamed protein product [Blepharisma stoltei]